MKKVLLATAIVALASTPVLAKDSARMIDVQDVYKNVTKQVPNYQTVCETVEVPIYGENKFDESGAIVGGLIGGVIGNQIGKGGGREAATGVGAIAGAIIGGKKDAGIVGYRQEQRCRNHTTYYTETLEEYSHSIVTFEHNGRKYRVRFEK